MPFKSEAQRRLFHAMAGRGEISKAKVKEWEDKTKNKGSLPEHVKKHEKKSEFYDVGVKLALDQVGLLKQAGWGHVAAAGIPVAVLAGLLAGGTHNMNEAVEKLQRLKLYGTLGGGALGAGAGALIGKQYDHPGVGALLGGSLGASLGRQVTPRALWDVGD